ncbi:ParB/sulfiredoxin [Vibrio phage 1.213.O._10N.222.54.F10]|nr:ParB/sulfiredoxin [Vibrio phage 1.213.O._10N.222.54.F10]
MKEHEYCTRKTVDLIPYANNSRTHSDEQTNQVASSIKEFGFTNPVLIDEDNGIIAGHGRILAAQKLSLDEVPCIILKGLTEAQKKAYVIADNQLALNSGWDLDMLKLEIESLEEMEFDIDLLGFDDDFLGDLLPEDEVEGLTDEDEVPEPPEMPVSVLGDIWQLGDHRLMCGDSTSIDAVMELLENKPAEMVHTDPPYGVSYQSNMRTESDKFDVLKNDDVFLDIAPVIEACSKGWVFVWTSWKVLTKWIDLFDGFGYPTNQVIWFKGGGGIGDLKKTFSSDYETALVWHRGSELTGKRIGSVWKVEKDGANSYVHPTQKPVALPEEAIDKTTKKGATVLDLFGGSGSTLIACEKTNRKARLMELDEKYVDVIINRWQGFTGKSAVHIESGKAYEELKRERVDS